MKLYLYLSILFLFFIFLVSSSGSVYASFNPANPKYGGLAIKESLGSVDTVDHGMVMVANLLVYVGWAGIIIGILAVLGLFIFKLVGTDNADTLKEAQGGIIKALIIALLGLLILSAGFFVNLSANIVGEGSVDIGLGDAP